MNKELRKAIVKGSLTDSARLLGDLHDLSFEEVADILKEIAELLDKS